MRSFLRAHGEDEGQEDHHLVREARLGKHQMTISQLRTDWGAMRRTGGTMDLHQNTSENQATSLDNLHHPTTTRITKSIDHHRRTNVSPAIALLAAPHLTVGLARHRQITNVDQANTMNTALLLRYHPAISTSLILLHLIRNGHTENQDGPGNLTGTVHRETIMIADLKIVVLLHPSITIIMKAYPSITAYELTTMTTIVHLHQSIIHTKTILNSSNCVQDVKFSNHSSHPLLQATKQSATYTPTARCTISTCSTSTASPQERPPTARSTHKICSC